VSGAAEERPRSVPEIRGMKPIPPEREDSYTAGSYAAQFGIYVEDAADLIARHGKHAHKAIEREILLSLARDVEERRRALLQDEALEPTETEKREAEAFMRKMGMRPPEGGE
jgi:hypothetical protein